MFQKNSKLKIFKYFILSKNNKVEITILKKRFGGLQLYISDPSNKNFI